MDKIAKIESNFKGKDILSLDQFDIPSIMKLFSYVPQMAQITKASASSDILKGHIVTLIFYEPSSRTFGSFSSAIKQLGGQTVEILSPQNFSSVAKGETLEDTMRTFQNYSQAIVLRHPEVGAAVKAAEAADVPILNAGDGIGEHPTQALLDLYTIYEHHKKLENLTGVFAGDMLNGRTVHSILRGLSMFGGNTVYLLSPKNLLLSREEYEMYTKKRLKIVEIESEEDIPQDADFWYWTRVQKERFSSLEEYETVKHRYILTPELIKQKAADQTIFMHPLPRVGEIDLAVDSDPRAIYFTKEIPNGKYVRMALMGLVLGKLV